MSGSVPGSRDAPPSAMRFALEPANLVSLAGLLSALLGIYFAILGVFPAAMIGIVWAVVFDWLDGRVARRAKDRTDEQRAFGGQLDSLIDVVSFGVAPAVVLLAVGGYQAWLIPGAAVALGAAVIRLSYFNVFGLADGSTYRGLALDNNALILVALFVFQPLLAKPVFVGLLYAMLIALAVLNLAPIRTPKFGGGWYYALLTFTAGVSAVFGARLAGLGL